MYLIISDSNFQEFLDQLLSEGDALARRLIVKGGNTRDDGLYFGNLSLANAQKLLTHLGKFEQVIQQTEGYVGFAHDIKEDVAQCLLPVVRKMLSRENCSGVGLINPPTHVIRLMLPGNGLIYCQNLRAEVMREMVACAREGLLVNNILRLQELSPNTMEVLVSALTELPAGSFPIKRIDDGLFVLTRYAQFRKLFLNYHDVTYYSQFRKLIRYYRDFNYEGDDTKLGEFLASSNLPYAVQMGEELVAMSEEELNKFGLKLHKLASLYQGVAKYAIAAVQLTKSPINLAEQLAQQTERFIQKFISSATVLSASSNLVKTLQEGQRHLYFSLSSLNSSSIDVGITQIPASLFQNVASQPEKTIGNCRETQAQLRTKRK